jgi:2-polyprenyl-3-methyl-5-hydroxy-6-metoxy-1,4-benzoquinol methylase
MGIGNITIEKLDYFVSECDRRGGVQSKEAAEFISDFSITYSTFVDQNLDPFSDEYFNQQISLYEELSNRKLDQNSGEQAPVDVDRCVNAANPYGMNDINFIAKHARANLTTLLVCSPPQGARVLDLGCGWGLSSEMAAFCGAVVDSVDINSLFVDLVNRRASTRNYDIRCIHSTFDSFQSEHLYDVAMFYECLHHSTKPWETLANIGRYIKSNGKITINGEPINSVWWKNWGLRLDPLSVYCIRKFGWFESGWSEKFISECFYRNGFVLTLMPYIGLDNGYVGIATRRDSKEIKPTSDSVIPKQIIECYKQSFTNSQGTNTSIQSYLSQIGTVLGDGELRPFIRANKGHSGGFLCYGPYITLPAGHFSVSFILHLTKNPRQESTPSIVFDIVSEGGGITHHREVITMNNTELKLVTANIVLTKNSDLLEARIFISQASVEWEVSLPVFEKIDSNLER